MRLNTKSCVVYILFFLIALLISYAQPLTFEEAHVKIENLCQSIENDASFKAFEIVGIPTKHWSKAQNNWLMTKAFLSIILEYRKADTIYLSSSNKAAVFYGAFTEESKREILRFKLVKDSENKWIIDPNFNILTGLEAEKLHSIENYRTSATKFHTLKDILIEEMFSLSPKIQNVKAGEINRKYNIIKNFKHELIVPQK